ncbi:P-loop containing nucleoside triphosphate hydrolase protein [Martensiomyces pterosporus]|nr:P-loop containing nucleoside triphosphate hydrolase protein [Martensiomyces pterosporus]
MTHSRTSSRHGSASRCRSSSRHRTARRDSRSPEPSSRHSPAYSPRRSRSPSRTAAVRPPPHAASPVNAAPESKPGGDGKKKGMLERLAMWRKRKEQEKSADQSPAAATPPPSAAPDNSDTHRSPSGFSQAPAEISGSRSRTSSMAEDSSSSVQFVTAPNSVASQSYSPSDSGHQSPAAAAAAAAAAGTAPTMHLAHISRPLGAPGLSPALKIEQHSSSVSTKQAGGAVKMKLGKIGLKPKRPQLKSSLGSSVFGAGVETDDAVVGTRLPRKLPLVPLSDADTAAAEQNDVSNSVPDATEPTATADADGMDIDVHDADPLEAYMQSVKTQMADTTSHKGADAGGTVSPAQAMLDDDTVNFDDGLPADPEDILAMAAKRLKKKDLASVDHSKMNYESFKKSFYIEPAELRSMTAEEVDMMRVDLGGIKIRGVDPPKPAHSWSHFGLPAACADVIKHQGFERPTPIQAQAVPAILSGRDVIGVAKTGSGKTLAFILPMLRHINAQRPLAQGDGPIGLVMTPTRELAVQIHRECKPFLKPLGLRAVCAYGGSAIKDQIGELKRGAEIVVCTPGRLIDLLCANSGRVTNLHRVTYLVLDEADRMFDMGFEPQVTKIVQSVRPSRQTVLFSATFPRQMEALARKILKRPLEIVVGGRALIPPEVTQHVEVVESKDKFVRLLAILGEAFNASGDTLALIFVDRQEAADGLLRDLMRRGYVCNSLHGGKDQTDRDQAIADFKSRVFSVLIATSVAARGLDVRGLSMVINYDCPNHMEDLVHRVGRTGRAGNKGDAFTFITPDQDRYASEVVKAMKLSGLTPPASVQAMADSFIEKVRQGKERHSSKSGFGGKGLEKLDKDRSMVKKIQKITYGGGADDDDDDEDEEKRELDSDGEAVSSKRKSKLRGDQTPDAEIVRRKAVATPNSSRLQSTASDASRLSSASPANNNGASAAAASAPSMPEGISAAARAALQAAQAAARRLNVGTSSDAQNAPLSVVDQINKQLGTPATPSASGASSAAHAGRDGSSNRDRRAGAGEAASLAANGASGGGGASGASAAIPVGEFACELDINDYPQKARWRATNRDTLSRIIDQTGAAITTRGIFVPPGKPVPEGERKLYLSIESDSERSVEQAKNELKRILTEATIHVMEQEARSGGGGRYSVV